MVHIQKRNSKYSTIKIYQGNIQQSRCKGYSLGNIFRKLTRLRYEKQQAQKTEQLLTRKIPEMQVPQLIHFLPLFETRKSDLMWPQRVFPRDWGPPTI